jgi:hypothetical protein
MTNPQIPTLQYIRQANTIAPDGSLRKAYTITFMVGSNGPFTEVVQGQDFNASNVKATMQKVADEINAVTPGA